MKMKYQIGKRQHFLIPGYVIKAKKICFVYREESIAESSKLRIPTSSTDLRLTTRVLLSVTVVPKQRNSEKRRDKTVFSFSQFCQGPDS